MLRPSPVVERPCSDRVNELLHPFDVGPRNYDVKLFDALGGSIAREVVVLVG